MCAAMKESPCVPALYSFILGSITSGSLIISFSSHEAAPNLAPFAAYLASLALFHFLEYYWQAKYHPSTTSSEGKMLALLLVLVFNINILLFSFSVLVKS